MCVSALSSRRCQSSVTLPGIPRQADLRQEPRAFFCLIAEEHPKSISKLATPTSRGERNLLRTLHELSAMDHAQLNKDEGGICLPVIADRKVHLEIGLLT
jgi:predicted transcriptional regulator